MSHFAIIVIGNDVENQLAPYHEFECTGINDKYVQDVDVTDKCREYGLDYYGLDDKTVTSEAEIDKAGEHEFGYAIVDAEGNLIKAVIRTNPNKKWDWWVVGGRWSNFLKLKSGGYADEAKKGEIDFDGMRNDACDRAAADYDKAAAAADGKSWQTWEHLREVVHKGNIDAAINAYNGQPAVSAIKAAFDEYIFFNPDKFLVPREQYVQQARDGATVLYAVVKDSQWLAKGEMGWFGMSNDTEEQGDWNRKVNEMLDALPDDTTITVVDCHI